MGESDYGSKSSNTDKKVKELCAFCYFDKYWLGFLYIFSRLVLFQILFYFTCCFAHVVTLVVVDMAVFVTIVVAIHRDHYSYRMVLSFVFCSSSSFLQPNTSLLPSFPSSSSSSSSPSWL